MKTMLTRLTRCRGVLAAQNISTQKIAKDANGSSNGSDGANARKSKVTAF